MHRPNILWITTHDINPHLGAYAGVYPGAEDAVTPNLDRLAAAGIRFDNAFAAAPVCAPSRSSIMTGCFPTSIGTMHMRTSAIPPAGVRLLPEYLREAGYYTTNAVFTDLQMPVPDSAFDEISPTAHWRDRPEGAPFFAAFHGFTTHESQIYLDDDAFAERTAHVPAAARHDPDVVALPPYHPDTAVFRRSWARYHDLITEMDHWVGGLLAELDDAGLADDTIVVFWSDHGLGMPRGKRWVTDAGLHEPLLVRWPGRIEPGVRTDLVHLLDLAPTMLALAGVPVPDHMQGRALLEADGARTAGANEYLFAGRDRMDEQEDTSRTVRDARFRYVRHLHPDRSAMQHCDYPDHLDTWRELRRLAFEEAGQLAQGAVRDRLTPLQRSLLAASKPGEEELYDLLADPHEEHDLAHDPRFAADLDRLGRALADWQERVGDLGLLPEEELLERWRPGGVWPGTEDPVVDVGGDGVRATSSTDGASLIWTDVPPADPPPPPPPPGPFVMGTTDGRRWRLLCDATPAPTDRPVWVRAWRLGYLPSREVPVRPRAG